MSIVFKNFNAKFISRPESDVFFVSEDGSVIQEIVDESVKTKERVTRDINIKAFVNYPENPVAIAEFELGLSVKDKSL